MHFGAVAPQRFAAPGDDRFEIGGGLGAYKGQVWRVGLMGYGSRAANVLVFLSALEQLLAQQGHKFQHGAGVAAAGRGLTPAAASASPGGRTMPGRRRLTDGAT